MAVSIRGRSERPRLRIRAGDLVPERRVVMEIEEEDGGIRQVEGYAWGPRCPGTVEARVLQHWNRDRDPNTHRIEGDPDFVAMRVREAMEEAVLDLCDTLTPDEVSVIKSVDLGRILEDLGFLLPAAQVEEEGEEGAEGENPPASDESSASPAEPTTPTPTT